MIFEINSYRRTKSPQILIDLENIREYLNLHACYSIHDKLMKNVVYFFLPSKPPVNPHWLQMTMMKETDVVYLSVK